MPKGYQAYKAVKVRVHQHFIGLRNKLGPLFEASVALAVGAICLAVLMHYKLASASDWVSIFITYVVTAISVFIVAKVTTTHSVLIEITMSYIIQGGRVLLDELLGKLIGRRWKREHIKPGDALFDVLENTSRTGNYETKRRVAEALPALGEIDAKRTLKLLQILRYDWDEEKYRSDIRRRTIEALVISAVPGHLPLAHRVETKNLEQLLILHAKDEIYTAFAVAEALNELLDGGKKASLMVGKLKLALHVPR